MKKHLTAIGVESLRPPKQGTLEIFDLGFPGLALRVGHGGAKSFEIFYRVNGKQVRENLGRWPSINLAQAREAWRRNREAIARGELPSHEGAKAPAMLFETVVEDWLKRDQAKNKPSSYYQAVRNVEGKLLPQWRGKRVDAIGKRDVIELLDSISDHAPVMAKRVEASVRRFFRWCMERDIIKIDPTATMERVRNGKSRERVLSDAELKAVWKASAEIGMHGHAIRLLALTGARREEVAQLRWSEIDGDCIKLEGARTKNGEAHIISLSRAAQKLLASVPRISGSDYVFTLSGERPISGWSRPKADLDAASGVTGWVIHDLRRTTATGLQKLGITLQVVETILGHTSGSRGGIVGVYQRHDFAEEKRAALEAWGKHVTKLVR